MIFNDGEYEKFWLLLYQLILLEEIIIIYINYDDKTFQVENISCYIDIPTYFNISYLISPIYLDHHCIGLYEDFEKILQKE